MSPWLAFPALCFGVSFPPSGREKTGAGAAGAGAGGQARLQYVGTVRFTRCRMQTKRES